MFILIYGFNFNKLGNIFSTISIFILSGARFIPSCSKIVAAIQNYRFNFGQALGLDGHLSVMPLLLVLFVGYFLVIRTQTKES